MNAVAPVSANFGAEQGLLGGLLLRNAFADQISWLKPEHFAEPAHARIFAASMELIAAGRSANPITLRPVLAADAQLTELGGDHYLARLIGSGPLPALVVDYARTILDAHLCRTLVSIGEGIAKDALRAVEPARQIAAATDALDELGRQVGQDGLRRGNDYRADVDALFRGERKKPISVGFRSLDQLYRIRPGELTIVTGIPSSGKSELVDAFAVNLAMREGWRFAVCSFENSPDEHIAKLAEKYVGRPFWRGRGERMSETDLGLAIDWVDEHFHFIRAERDSPTVDWALARAKAAADRFKIAGAIFDPWNEFEHSRPQGISETEYISRSLSAIKRFCARQQVHGWLIAHPAKPHPDKRDDVPSLYDIAGSAHFANKADVGISVHRPFLPDGNRSPEVAVHVKKVRFRAVGKPGVAKLLFNSGTGRYEEIDGGQSASSDWHDRE